jgi:hypothetical protein
MRAEAAALSDLPQVRPESAPLEDSFCPHLWINASLTTFYER